MTNNDRAPPDELVRQILAAEYDPDFEATTLQKCTFIARKFAEWGREQERAELPWKALAAAIHVYCAQAGPVHPEFDLELREFLALYKPRVKG